MSSTPDPTGIHPVDYSLQKLGRFSGGLAAVRQRGFWGYVDRNGKAVVPFLFEKASPFNSGYAVVRRDGRWEIIDTKGVATPLPRPLSDIAPFSEGLAAARERAAGPWGYIDRTGSFVIPPQFDRADNFSNGLAAVDVKGTWLYVTPTGSIALVTPHFRAYGFSADGLALFQEKRDGGYGYLRRDGTVAIPPVFPEARAFSGGVAPVRIGDRWGYISRTGEQAIAPLFDDAFPFAGRLALVRSGQARLGFIDASGLRAHENDFTVAESYSEGVAVVGDGFRLWYVDELGKRVPAGEVLLGTVGSQPASCDPSSVESVNGYNFSGLIFFRIVNQTDLRWNVELVDTLANSKKYSASTSGLDAVPGYPVAVEPASGPGGGIHTFLHKWIVNGSGYATGNYPQFDMYLTSGDWKAALSSANNYTAPPPATTHPWWEWVQANFEAMHGMYEVIMGATEGNLLEAAKGAYGIFKAGREIADGTVDGASSNNDNDNDDKTANIFVTDLKAFSGGARLQPMDGGYCGGDSYTLSDGSQFVFALTTAKSKRMPPTFQLTITPYAAFFAQQALGKLDTFRKGTESGGAYVTSDYYSCVYPLAFQNWSDNQNNTPCSAPAAYPKYDYMKVASALSPNDALDWWSFSNNLPTTGKDYSQVGKWARTFGGNCGTLAASCPSVAPMTADRTVVVDGTWGATCNPRLLLTNAAGPISLIPDAKSPQSVTMSTDCATRAPFAAPCNLWLKVDSGASGVQPTVTDGLTSIPLTLTCQPLGMSVSPPTFSGSSFPEPCSLQASVYTPAGSVSVTPASWVTMNNCFVGGLQASSSACIVGLSIPPGTAAQPVTFNDGKTTATVTAACADIPMTLGAATYQGQAIPGATTCAIPVSVGHPHATVSLPGTPASWVSSSTCTGPAAGCAIGLAVPAGTSAQTVRFTDGATSVGASFTCSGCQGMSLPNGPSYTPSKAGCQVWVPVDCVTPPLQLKTLSGLFQSIDLKSCSKGGSCQVGVSVVDPGTIRLTDGASSTVSFEMKACQ